MNPLKDIKKIKQEISKVVVGQHVVIDSLLRAILADGHVIVEGVPGIAKTLLIRAMAVVTGCSFKRIQFTVDLLPTDITGITAYHEKKGFYIVKGPIFANYIIADEVNRAPPKTQSAMLEAMQEKQTTIGKQTFPMMKPFFVMANNNPIEQSGVYPLPEAQVDRFLFKLKMGYPDEKQSKEIIEKNITLRKFEDYDLKSIITPAKILQFQAFTKKVKHTDRIKNYICKLVTATRNPKKYGVNIGKYLEWGASPRANIGLFIAAKADAVLKGHKFITPSHVKNVAYEVLRHRILLNYRGRAEGLDTDDVVKEILAKVPL